LFHVIPALSNLPTTREERHVSERKFIAAVKQPDGNLTTLRGDGDEPVADVAKAMLDIGAQPESVEALVKHTALSTAKRRAQRIAIEARHIAAADMLRKSMHAAGFDDEAVLGVLDGSLIPFSGSKGDRLLKAVHRPNRHAGTGRFEHRDAGRTLQEPSTGIVWREAKDSVSHPVMLGLFGSGKREPTDTGKPVWPDAYEGAGGSNPGGNG
jgi:hypothetical protein